MILGLYEAHLPVSDLNRSVEFYAKLGLELAWRKGDIAFFWIEKEKSWLGLWEGDAYQTPYHPSLRHLAFRVSYEELKNSVKWLQDRDIEAVPFAEGDPIDPFVRPSQGNASVYFKDPDGNSLEFMCFVDVPDRLKSIPNKFSMTEWEKLLEEAAT
ncbi:extradiol dioxygenase [Saccharibacillus sp. O23]|uniref:VOC family protein n=1 Tax=Saccharibacillus sp. O23 TaxID=2009338 RepID=UPI000B4E6B51|nr:VOC family protein [Saccharibacillus sp. O23]OWR32331.1 extradiol dioxygenase [Saccharibacillus sp. O23]